MRDAVLHRLAEAACGAHTQRVIEIGPGRGALTRHLLPRTDELHAVELDAGFAEQLSKKFELEPKVHIHRGDVLETDLSQWGPAVIAGNLPYYITSPILQKFFSLDEGFPVAVFLVQKEVADRLTAEPGTRAYGYLTVATALVCEVELVCNVPAEAFVPPPKVASAAIKLIRRQAAHSNREELLTFLGRCFFHKRKTLRNNLRQYYGSVIDVFPEASMRAEQLTVEQLLDVQGRLRRTEQTIEPSVN